MDGSPHWQQPQQYGAPPVYPHQWAPPLAALPTAHLGKRWLARFVDTIAHILITAAVTVPLFILVFKQDPDVESGASVLVLVLLVLFIVASYLLYDAVQLHLWEGRTIGKRMLRLRVASVAEPHLPLSRGKAYARGAVYPFGAQLTGMVIGGLVNLLDVLWPFWDQPNRQALHDKIVGTVVLEDVPLGGLGYQPQGIAQPGFYQQPGYPQQYQQPYPQQQPYGQQPPYGQPSTPPPFQQPYPQQPPPGPQQQDPRQPGSWGAPPS